MTKHRLHIYSTLLLLLILPFSCNSKSTNLELPSWVQAPPKNNPDYIYGVGNGKTLKQAQQSAIAMVAGYFESSVSQRYTDYQKKVNKEYTRTTQVLTSVEISNVALSSVEFSKTEQLGDNIFVLAKLDVKAYVATTTAKLEGLDKQVRAWFTDLNTRSYLRILARKEAVFARLDDAQKLYLMLSVLDAAPITDFSHYITLSNQISKALDEGYIVLVDESTNVVNKKNTSQPSTVLPHNEFQPMTLQAVKGLLASYGVNIKQKKTAPSHSTSSISSLPEQANAPIVIVRINLQTQQDERGAYRTLLSVALRSTQDGVELGNNTLESRARSYKTETDSVKKAIQSMSTSFIKKPITAVLGLPQNTLLSER